MFEKVEGIVLRTKDYGETNKIVTLFTREYGLISGVARGAKKQKVEWLRLRSHLSMEYLSCAFRLGWVRFNKPRYWIV